jgi:hypothetical protein
MWRKEQVATASTEIAYLAERDKFVRNRLQAYTTKDIDESLFQPLCFGRVSRELLEDSFHHDILIIIVRRATWSQRGSCYR